MKLQTEFKLGDTVCHVTTGSKFFVDVDYNGRICHYDTEPVGPYEAAYATSHYTYLLKVGQSRMVLTETTREWRRKIEIP